MHILLHHMHECVVLYVHTHIISSQNIEDLAINPSESLTHAPLPPYGMAQASWSVIIISVLIDGL